MVSTLQRSDDAHVAIGRSWRQGVAATEAGGFSLRRAEPPKNGRTPDLDRWPEGGCPLRSRGPNRSGVRPIEQSRHERCGGLIQSASSNRPAWIDVANPAMSRTTRSDGRDDRVASIAMSTNDEEATWPAMR